MTKKSYRIYNPGTEEYISEVHGMMRYEAYNKVDSAYAYDLQDALDILKHAKSMNKFIADNDEFPAKMREGCRQAPIIIPISINEVRISMDEATAAIDTAQLLDYPAKTLYAKLAGEELEGINSIFITIQGRPVISISICTHTFKNEVPRK